MLTVAASAILLPLKGMYGSDLVVKWSGPHDLNIISGSAAAKKAFLNAYFVFREYSGTLLELCVEHEMLGLKTDTRFSDPGAGEHALLNCGYPFRILPSTAEEVLSLHMRRYGRMPTPYEMVDILPHVTVWRHEDYLNESPKRFSERYPERPLVRIPKESRKSMRISISRPSGVLGRWSDEKSDNVVQY